MRRRRIPLPSGVFQLFELGDHETRDRGDQLNLQERSKTLEKSMEIDVIWASKKALDFLHVSKCDAPEKAS